MLDPARAAARRDRIAKRIAELEARLTPFSHGRHGTSHGHVTTHFEAARPLPKTGRLFAMHSDYLFEGTVPIPDEPDREEKGEEKLTLRDLGRD